MVTQALSTSSWHCPRWIPIITPAVNENSCEVDHFLLIARIATIFFTSISFLVVSLLLCPHGMFCVICIISPSLMGLPSIDWWLANKAANIKAVDEYVKKNAPSTSATYRIIKNLSAAKLLVSEGGDLNKLNEKGQRFFSSTYALGSDMKVFQYFVDQGIDLITKTDSKNKTIFRSIVERENPEYLRYVLSNNKVKPNDINTDEQVELWINIGSSKTGKILHQYEFNVNVRDKEGFTPLHRLVRAISENKYFNWQFPLPEALVNTLLECGADKNLTVKVNGEEKTALQLCSDPAVKKIIEEWK